MLQFGGFTISISRFYNSSFHSSGVSVFQIHSSIWRFAISISRFYNFGFHRFSILIFWFHGSYLVAIKFWFNNFIIPVFSVSLFRFYGFWLGSFSIPIILISLFQFSSSIIQIHGFNLAFLQFQFQNLLFQFCGSDF